MERYDLGGDLPGELALLDYESSGVQKLGNGSVGLMNLDTKPKIDVDDMSVGALICTSALDRLGDVIEAAGVRLDNYALNAIVLHEHGLKGISVPIATADKGGKIDLDVHFMTSPDRLVSRSYFSASQPESYQVFGLINEGFLRTTSISVLPDEANTIVAHDGRMRMKSSDMTEYSWVAIPVNPQCVRRSMYAGGGRLRDLIGLQMEAASKILRTRSLGSHRLLPAVARSLQASLPLKKPLTRQAPEQQMAKKRLSANQVARLGKLAFQRSLAVKSAFTPDTQRLLDRRRRQEYRSAIRRSLEDGLPPEEDEELDAMFGGEELAGGDEFGEDIGGDSYEPDTGGGGMEEESFDEFAAIDDLGLESDLDLESEAALDAPIVDDPKPQGATALEAVHGRLKDVLAACQAAMEPVEHETVKAGAEDICTQLEVLIGEIEGLFTTAYPDLSGLSVEPTLPTEEVMRSFWANPKMKFQLLGVAARLEHRARRRSLGANERAAFRRDAAALRRIHARSSGSQELVPIAVVKGMERELAQLMQRLANKPAQLN